MRASATIVSASARLAGLAPWARREWALVGLVAALAALGLATTGPRAVGYSLWQDEVASAEIVVEPTPGHVALEVTRGESMPPAWYTLAWVVHNLGLPVELVRLMSVSFTVALLALLVLYARTLLPLWGAGLAGLLVALGWHFVRHGWELRAYALLALLSVALGIVMEASAERADRRRLVLLGSVVALGSLTHYFFLLALASSLAWLWTSRAAEPARRRVTAAVGVGLLPFLAWIPALVEQYGHGRFAWIGPFSARDVLTLYLELFGGPRARPEALFAAIALALVLLGALRLARGSERGRHCAFLAVGPVALAAALWLAGSPIFQPRNLLVAGPFAAVAVAGAVAALPGRAALVGGLTTAALAVALYARDAPSPPPDYERIAAELVAEGWSTNDPIVLVGPLYATRGPLRWYLPARPDLRVGVPTGRACPQSFLVSSGAAVPRVRGRRIGRFLVARLGSSSESFPSSPRRAHLLGAVGGAPCLRLLPR